MIPLRLPSPVQYRKGRGPANAFLPMITGPDPRQGRWPGATLRGPGTAAERGESDGRERGQEPVAGDR